MKHNTAILDIGSSKVICLICSAEGRDSITVRGAGVKEYDGFVGNRFADEQQFANAVVDSIAMAEGEARVRIKDLSVGVPASFSKLVLQEGSAEVTSRSGRITADTIDDLINDSLSFEYPAGFELMHSTPVEFNTGETVTSEPPIGNTAEHVTATVSHVFVDSAFKRVVSDALDRAGLAADMYINVPLSSSLFVIPEKERTDCAVLIDVGAKQTDISLIRGSALIACETLAIGGANFAGDIAYGLRIPNGAAENVKRRYVYSLDYQDSIDIVRIEGRGALRVEHAVIQYIIEERTKQLASHILSLMKEMGVNMKSKPPIYLTGGGIALMRGSCEYLEKLIGAPIKVRMPWMPRLSSPNYASAFSVMDFVMHADDEDNVGRLVGMVAESKFIKKLKGLFESGR